MILKYSFTFAVDVGQQKVKESYVAHCTQTESGCQSWDIPQAMQ